LSAGGDEAAERVRVFGVVFGQHPAGGLGAGGFEDILVALGQRVPALLVDTEADLRAALPESGVVVVLAILTKPSFSSS
jgi:hypothetical protein